MQCAKGRRDRTGGQDRNAPARSEICTARGARSRCPRAAAREKARRRPGCARRTRPLPAPPPPVIGSLVPGGGPSAAVRSQQRVLPDATPRSILASAAMAAAVLLRQGRVGALKVKGPRPGARPNGRPLQSW